MINNETRDRCNKTERQYITKVSNLQKENGNWLIIAIYWQIINLYFTVFSSILQHNFNNHKYEFQNNLLFHDYVLLFSNLILADKYC